MKVNGTKNSPIKEKDVKKSWPNRLFSLLSEPRMEKAIIIVTALSAFVVVSISTGGIATLIAGIALGVALLNAGYRLAADIYEHYKLNKQSYLLSKLKSQKVSRAKIPSISSQNLEKAKSAIAKKSFIKKGTGLFMNLANIAMNTAIFNFLGLITSIVSTIIDAKKDNQTNDNLEKKELIISSFIALNFGTEEQVNAITKREKWKFFKKAWIDFITGKDVSERTDKLSSSISSEMKTPLSRSIYSTKELSNPPTFTHIERPTQTPAKTYKKKTDSGRAYKKQNQYT